MFLLKSSNVLEKKNYLRIFMFLYLVILIWSAIDPMDYAVWFLEILGVIFIISVYFYYNNSIQFSILTSTWFFIAVSLITIGAHFSFPNVPLFDKITAIIGMDRNNFDKLGHIVQGILPVLIGREVLIKKGITRDYFWNNFLAFTIAMSVSAIYELIEWLFIILLGNNEYTYEVLGTQGYIWDAQSDMLMAFIGALLTVLFTRRHFLQLIKR